MIITGMTEHTQLYVNVQFAPEERPVFKPGSSATYRVLSVVVEFSGIGVAVALLDSQPRVKVVSAFRVNADGGQGVLIGRDHYLYPVDIGDSKHAEIVETARKEALRQMKETTK